MQDHEVTFLEQPRVGQPCRIEVDGQRLLTPAVANRGAHPTNVGWFRIETTDGAFYAGPQGVPRMTRGECLARVALAIGCIVGYFAIAMAVPLACWIVFLGTSVWVLIDAKAECGRKGYASRSYVEWFIGCLLLWIVAFPMYVFRRGFLREQVAVNWVTVLCIIAGVIATVAMGIVAGARGWI